MNEERAAQAIDWSDIEEIIDGRVQQEGEPPPVNLEALERSCAKRTFAGKDDLPAD